MKDQEDEVEDGRDKSRVERGSKRDQTHRRMTHGWYDAHSHLEPMSCETSLDTRANTRKCDV